MKRIGILTLIFALFFSCENITQKLQKDLQKTDSLVTVAADSLEQLIKGEKQDTVGEQEVELVQEDEQYYKQMLIGTYATIMKSIKTKDTIILRQFLYLPDSILLVRSQGIFQVVQIEPMAWLFEYEYFSPPQQAWECQLVFGPLPELEANGWSEQGCFAERKKELHKFSALIGLALDAGLALPERVVNVSKQIEQKIMFEVVNTYLGWSFYFVQENGKLYLAAVDFNQY